MPHLRQHKSTSTAQRRRLRQKAQRLEWRRENRKRQALQHCLERRPPQCSGRHNGQH